MEGSIYFASPIWIICAIISFFLAEDWEENPWSVGIMSLILGPITLIIYLIGSLSNIGARDRAIKKGEEIKSKNKTLLEQIKINKPNIINKIEQLRFETDVNKRDISKEHLQELINDWREIEAITEEEYVSLTKKLRIQISSPEIISSQKKIIDLFIQRPTFFKDMISQYYKLNESMFEKYQDNRFWWSKLSRNESLQWSIELIEKYQNKWNWQALSKNKSIPWSENIIEKFKDKWDWSSLSQNEFLPWSENLIEKYIDLWRWDIGYNTALPWSTEFVEKYGGKHGFKWMYLTSNSKLPWSSEFIEKYRDNWDWHLLGDNTGLPWSIELIEKYIDDWDWRRLSNNNSLPWSVELIDAFYDKWNWEFLSGNSGLPWSLDLIEKYKNKWRWDGFYFNKKSDGIFEKNMRVGFSVNEKIPWSLEFIEKYEDKLGWYDENTSGCYGISLNEGIPWSLELIEKYKDKFDWFFLSENESLPWSVDLIKHFENKWNWERMYIKATIKWQKAFQPFVDDEVIEEVMKKIK